MIPPKSSLIISIVAELYVNQLEIETDWTGVGVSSSCENSPGVGVGEYVELTVNSNLCSRLNFVSPVSKSKPPNNTIKSTSSVSCHSVKFSSRFADVIP